MENLEIKLRKEAIKLITEGSKPSQVAVILKRSKVWVCKWHKRFLSDPLGPWFEEQSRRPLTSAVKIDRVLENQILAIRKQLQDNKYSQQGALSIQYAFEQMNKLIPPVWAINRVIKRHNLVNPAPKHKKIKSYPEHYISVQQIDFVGPRYIRNDGRFNSLNIIDVPTHMAGVYPCRSMTGEDALKGLIQFWKDVDIPDCVQMDNALCFRGSNKHPRSLNKFLRFVLSQGVVALFIPKGEPWRNGVIERFNNTFDKKFIRSQQFKDFDALCREAPCFTDFHNTHHRYSCLQGKTPRQAYQNGSLKPLRLPQNYEVAKKIPLESGVIYSIFFLRSDCQIEVFGTKFKINPILQYSYITAKIIIDIHTLTIERDNEIFHIYPFKMPTR